MDLCTLHAQIVRPFLVRLQKETIQPASIAASTAITAAAVAIASAIMAGMMT